MGGSKKKDPWETVKDTAEGAAKSGLQVGSGGLYDPNSGSIGTGEKQLANVGSGVSGQTIMNQVNGTAPAKIPDAEDPQEIARKAKAEADAKVAAELGAKSRGLSSTIMGGTTVVDNSNLRKKKLLGE